MERVQHEAGAERQADVAARTFREQGEPASEAAKAATLTARGTLKLTTDDDVGCDPYNRTGNRTRR